MRNNYDDLVFAFKTLLSPERLGVLGCAVRFVKRLRVITPTTFVRAVVLSRFGSGLPGFEQARQCFCRLAGRSVFARPFQMRFKAASAVQLMASAFEEGVRNWRLQPRRVRHPLLKYFSDVVAWDASPVRVADELRPIFKGLRKVPAQIKVLLAVSVFGLLPLAARLVAGSQSDLRLPPPFKLFRSGTLFLFDKGFLNYNLLRQIHDAQHFYLCPARVDVSGLVVAVHEGPKWARQAMKQNPNGFQLRTWLPEKKRFHSKLDVTILVWPSAYASDPTPVRTRLVILHSEHDEQRPYLTNIELFIPPLAIREAYRLRWQIELVFKELKQHLNLESVPTKDPNAAQVFVWASLIALAVSRTANFSIRQAHVGCGLACPIRPALVSRALRSMAAALANLFRNACSPAYARALLEFIRVQSTKPPKSDSLHRLRELLPIAA